MSQVCPLLFRQIDATIAKLSAALVLVGLIAYVITACPAILIAVILDFVIRLSPYKPLSPIYQGAMFIQKVLKMPVNMTDAGAKRLAAYFGLTFTVGMLIAHFFAMTLLMWVIASIFIGCIVLDLLFDYCIACKVYTLYFKLFSKNRV
jgi:hypothetical protein